jgi:hypothetical protein
VIFFKRKLINAENEPFDCVFDEVYIFIILIKINRIILKKTILFKRMVLIGLLYKRFIVNLLNSPNSFIYVRKQDVLNIRSISFGHYLKSVNLTGSSAIDLTKLVPLIKKYLNASIIMLYNITIISLYNLSFH